MIYRSTRDKSVETTAAGAIAKGISKEGGLFVPTCLPTIESEEFSNLCSLDYIGRAKYILQFFLKDFTASEIDYCVNGAYSGTFDNDDPAPLYKLENKKYVLELWHGPTCAFKDLALQLLPFLLTTSAKKTSNGKKTIILVATSGDTGKAALEGFGDVENTEIIVFYPSNGVSSMQKLQMDTQKGSNVFVCSIDGNFDDAQTGVKKIFTDSKIEKQLLENNMVLSSANSINWGRLLPQIIYYVSAYCDLISKNEDLSDGFDVVVPTGNFGNILAAYYAKTMGVPITKLVCASNENNILTDFINTGVYDRNRDFHTTVSPSMDILISSNLERMLYELCGKDSSVVSALQDNLAEKGRFVVNEDIFNNISKLFYAGCCDDAKTLETIRSVFKKHNYLCDTHTAVAFAVAEEYQNNNKSTRPIVIDSTASPYKFAQSVLKAISPQDAVGSEFDMVEKLSAITKTQIPTPIKNLKGATPRFNNVCDIEGMADVVLDYLKA